MTALLEVEELLLSHTPEYCRMKRSIENPDNHLTTAESLDDTEIYLLLKELIEKLLNGDSTSRMKIADALAFAKANHIVLPKASSDSDVENLITS